MSHLLWSGRQDSNLRLPLGTFRKFANSIRKQKNDHQMLYLLWSGRQDSNLRPQRPKRRALPTVPRPATVKFTTLPLKMQ